MPTVKNKIIAEATAQKLAALRAWIPGLKWKLQAKYGDAGQGKVQKGIVVAFIDARDVSERLDNVCGLEWHAEYSMLEGTGILTVECALTVLGTTRHDIGTVDLGKAKVDKEMAVKAAYSDALKRAAVQFGVGRFVYRLPKVEAQLEQRGASWYIVKAALSELTALSIALSDPAAKAGRYQYIRTLSDMQLEELPFGYEDDSEEEGEARETTGDRKLTNLEAQDVHKSFGLGEIPKDEQYEIAAGVCQRKLTSFQDIYLSERPAVLEAGREWLRVQKRQSASAVAE